MICTESECCPYNIKISTELDRCCIVTFGKRPAGLVFTRFVCVLIIILIMNMINSYTTILAENNM